MKGHFIKVWRDHKLKILGFLAMFWGFLQVNFDQIREIIPERFRGVVLFAFGLLAMIFGFISQNSTTTVTATVVETTVDPPAPPT